MAREWDEGRRNRAERLRAASPLADGKLVEAVNATALLEALIRPGDRICLEGNNQKQADHLARTLVRRTLLG